MKVFYRASFAKVARWGRSGMYEEQQTIKFIEYSIF
jgi:hypothetical protein